MENRKPAVQLYSSVLLTPWRGCAYAVCACITFIHVVGRGCTRGPNGFLQQVVRRPVNLITVGVGGGRGGRPGDKRTLKATADDHVMTVESAANDKMKNNNPNKEAGRTPTLLQLLS